MSVQLLPLCSVGKMAISDGYTGRTARLLLPFYQYGYWFASGQQYVFPTGTIRQYPGYTMQGTRQANTYVKAYGVCLQA